MLSILYHRVNYFYPQILIFLHANYELAAAGIIGMLDNTCKYYINNKGKYELKDVKNSMFKTIFHGLMAK